MSDLISRKALLKKFWKFTNGGKQRYLIPEEIWEMVELEPTAYDVDKVVEQLEEIQMGEYSAKAEYVQGMNGNSIAYCDGAINTIEKAIEIVKGGAV